MTLELVTLFLQLPPDATVSNADNKNRESVLNEKRRVRIDETRLMKGRVLDAVSHIEVIVELVGGGVEVGRARTQIDLRVGHALRDVHLLQRRCGRWWQRKVDRRRRCVGLKERYRGRLLSKHGDVVRRRVEVE